MNTQIQKKSEVDHKAAEFIISGKKNTNDSSLKKIKLLEDE